ncbi:MAG: bifunctional ADP-heptose synthase [Ginsengibacter sp.]
MPVDFDKLFRDITKLKVVVIGDVMLDTYWWGDVDRISPEGPVPVVAVTNREHRVGGAGNVALNVRSLEGSVSVISIVGDDHEGEQLTKLMADKDIDTSFILKSSTRVTTNKIRIIGRNQQMMRLDAETTREIEEDHANELFRQLENCAGLKMPEVVILQDYNKGVLTEPFIKKIIDFCNANNIVCAADPKIKNFFAYKNVTLFKPNLKEVREGLQILSGVFTIDKMSEVHQLLKEKVLHKISLITMSEKGVFYESDDASGIISSHIRNIADVSGAGDTVIAVASLIYAVTKSVILMAEIANIAGGLVCEEVGTIAIDKQKLLAECKRLLVSPRV